MKRRCRLLSKMAALTAMCLFLTGCGVSEEFVRSEAGFVGRSLWNSANMLLGNILHGAAPEQYKSAIMSGNIEWMREIKANNPGMNMTYTDHTVALYCAAWESNAYDKEKVMREIVELGADVNVGRILMLSTFNVRADVTRVILESGNADISIKDEDISLLTSAMDEGSDKGAIAMEDSYQQVKMLIEAGLEPYPELFFDDKEEGERGTHFYHVYGTPLAAKYAMERFLELYPDFGGVPAGLVYAFSGQTDKCAAEVEAHADEYANSSMGAVITMYAGYFGTPEEYERIRKVTGTNLLPGIYDDLVRVGNLEMLTYLIEQEEYDLADEEDQFGNRYELYYAAAQCGHKDIVRWLIDQKVNVKKYENGFFEIAAALASGDRELMDMVFEYTGSKYELIDYDIAKAFYIADFPDTQTAMNAVDYIMERGYGIDLIEFRYMTREFAEYVYSKGRALCPSDLTYAVLSCDPDFVDLVLDQGADPDQNAFDGLTSTCAWNLSIESDGSEPFAGWRDRKAQTYPVDYRTFIDVHADSKEVRFFTPRILTKAIWCADSGIVKLLIDRGADIRKSDFAAACIESSYATAEVVLAAGADLSATYTDSVPFWGIAQYHNFVEHCEFRKREDIAELAKKYL